MTKERMHNVTCISILQFMDQKTKVYGHVSKPLLIHGYSTSGKLITKMVLLSNQWQSPQDTLPCMSWPHLCVNAVCLRLHFAQMLDGPTFKSVTVNTRHFPLYVMMTPLYQSCVFSLRTPLCTGVWWASCGYSPRLSCTLPQCHQCWWWTRPSLDLLQW